MDKENKIFWQNLDILFNPKTVAVVGASNNQNKLGFHVMKSLTSGGYRGKILPINPGSEEIFGLPAFSSLTQCEPPADLAILVLPSKAIPDIFNQCHQAGVKAIVLITAGFKEIEDPVGAKQQMELAELANAAGIPVIGPNTFGMINFHQDLNASFTPEFSWLEKGGIALVSQSGGISHLLGFMGIRQQVGMSKIVGLGNRLNVDFAHMVSYLAEDDATEVIALYIEGIEEPRRLMDTARDLYNKKPIIGYKTGSAHTADLASKSHTGSMAGKQEIYEGAFRQSGIYPVRDSEELLDLAQVLSVCPLPEGSRVAVLSGQAGPSMAVCDVCSRMGLEITSFTDKTQAVIEELLPPLALRQNPVDMGPAWYNSQAVNGIVQAVMEDEQVDCLLLLMMFASANVQTVPDLADLFRQWKQNKPVISCFISPPGIWDQVLQDLEKERVLVNMPTPERAGRAMASLWSYKKMLKYLGGK